MLCPLRTVFMLPMELLDDVDDTELQSELLSLLLKVDLELIETIEFSELSFLSISMTRNKKGLS